MSAAVSLGPRTAVASVSTYAEAQQLVDTLADRQFPVEHVDIVGSDLRLVEHVIGRLTIARAALGGAITGAWFGLLIGLVFSIVTPWTVAPFVSAILIGLGFGAVYGALAQAFMAGKRDFASLRTLEAARYDVVVDAEHADDAQRKLLAAGTGRTAPVVWSYP
ncbi:MAG TPA: general stress protein [Frankiaceae bacterium]|jgi:hypothetical protein|nr:general stress protein [Frankiaceae bacterium]